MRIQYQKGDPRAGRVVDIDAGIAKRFIEAGVAKEVGADVRSTGPNDIPDDDGSRGDTGRPSKGVNATADETTTEDAAERRRRTGADARKGGGSENKDAGDAGDSKGSAAAAKSTRK